MTFTPSALALAEATWRETLHPRGRVGRWIEKALDKFDPPQTVGATPYLQKLSDVAGSPVPKTYDEAAALHRDPRWAHIFRDFEKTAEDLARKNDVQLVAGERNVGVFEGTFEPSYTLKVHKGLFDKHGDQRIENFARQLGQHFQQKAVVGFTVHPDGPDVELRIPKTDDPDAFYRDLVKIMGKDNAGITYGDEEWRIFIGSFLENPEKIAEAVAAAAANHGVEAKAFPGTGNYYQLRGGVG